MKCLLILLCFLFSSVILLSQSGLRHTISGYVREDVSGESLAGVNIYIPDNKAGTVTNTYGFYSITIEGKNTILVFSYIGYSSDTVRVNLDSDKELNIDLKPNVMLAEVTVAASRKDKQSESAMVRLGT